MTNAITARDRPIGTLYMLASSIFAPTNISTTDSPSLRYRNRRMTPLRRKYIARSPRMAKTFDV